MFDPEYYVGAWRGEDGSWATSKYTDSARIAGDQQVVWERRVFYIVPVPGEAEWAVPAQPPVGASDAAQGGGQGTDKRAREEPESSVETYTTTTTTTPGGVGVAAAANGVASASPDSKKPRGRVDDQGLAPGGAGIAALVPSQRGGHVLLKVYGTQAHDIKLNEVLDCVCILAIAPEATCFFGAEDAADGNGGADFMEEEEAHNPPQSAVPRLHAVLVARAQPTLLAGVAADAVPTLRARCVQLLRAACCGDALAAEYMLLHLVSRVHARPDPFAVGALSINLQLPRSDTDETSSHTVTCIRTLLTALASRCVALDLTVDALNAALLAPYKCYTTNRLVAGPLQLAGGTHILLDETRLQPGQLGEVGVRNVEALRDVISCQKVDVDFKYYATPLPTDTPVLILSRGSSLLPSDVAIPLRCTAAAGVPGADQLTDAHLAPLRAYLAAAKHAAHTIGADVAAAVESDLVEARAVDTKLGQGDFHRWLTLARLVGLSNGESSMTTATWQRVRELEHAVAQRRRVLPH